MEDVAESSEKKPRLDTLSASDVTVESPLDSVVPPESIGGSSSKPPKVDSKRQKKKKQKHVVPESGTSEDVIFQEVITLLGKEVVEQTIADGMEWTAPFELREEVELTISSMSSSGEALATAPSSKRPWVVVVPFSLPGEKIRARIYRHGRMYSHADLISVDEPNPEMRDMSLVKCKYFGTCAGCQYQMISYDTQLDLKRNVVVKAYQNYSDLPQSSIPPISSTIPSPLQYGYRTKITPHFDAPPKKLQKKGAIESEDKPDWLKIGFNQIGRRTVMDIEECPIATPVLNERFSPLRLEIAQKIFTYKKGVSLLLRDSLEIPGGNLPTPTTAIADPVDALASSLEKHVCITDHKATVRERVGDKLFDYQAGSFFQNNNSVLIPLTSYVKDAIFPPSSSAVSSASPTTEQPTHLVDAYCGAGLFAISLAPHFSKVAGIELSADSIRFATHNAALNNLPDGQCSFRAGDAANIFQVVSDFPADRTVLVIDPPRKGCDEKFIRQLLDFRPTTVVYVSCNVHTQARDVGMILRWSEEGEKGRYVLDSLRGFDLFPQTAHVESVAVLRLVT
ncbi:S-adenosyl-L-methionine-dependent methyltransferase [Artomyces pyxidatus]|uniref:S-adenosyl-L-methionine-dependent methyltransferase n=1 Tax=Artomyces pyxidatus TaxID=48021 RepID=A0ACB8SJR4_9AGAM|nr:S-adenosyl-L-methionine-dependent methyltransferase [Artomyces pyxidatus]